jgi:hypothetical protein
MAIGDIKTFDFVYDGLVLQINAIDMGDGTVRFEITCLEGSADINALYWHDDVADGANVNLGGSLNMNGTGEDWDGAYKLSSAGIGPLGEAKPTYLQEGESYVLDLTLSWADLDTLGVRATSTSTAGGSIKGVDGEPDITYAPDISVDDAACVVEGSTTTFTINLSQAYDYDIEIFYETQGGTATEDSDFAGTSGSVIIAAGQTSTTVDVVTTDDGEIEDADEHFTLNLTAAKVNLDDDADFELDLTTKITDDSGEGCIEDNDDTPPPVDTVVANNDDPDCGVEGLVKVTGNVLTNDTDSLTHDLDITHVNGTALLTLDPTPVGTVYEFAITGGTLKIDAETGAFEFTYDNIGNPLPVGGEWEGSFTYTVTDGDDDNDSDDSVHTATVDLCVDGAAGSQGYWTGGSNPVSEGFADGVDGLTFDDFFHLDNDPNDPLDVNGGRTWGDTTTGSPPNFYEIAAIDLTFEEALDFGQGNSDVGDETSPTVNGNIGDLVREASTAVLNFYDDDGHDAFVTAYEAQFGSFSDDNNDQAVLDDLRARVETAIETSDVTAPYMITELANQLHLTHE